MKRDVPKLDGGHAETLAQIVAAFEALLAATDVSKPVLSTPKHRRGVVWGVGIMIGVAVADPGNPPGSLRPSALGQELCLLRTQRAQEPLTFK